MRAEVVVGDCLDILPTIDASSVDLVVTDPPYIIGAVSLGNATSKAGTWVDMMNSTLWFSAWMRECQRVLRPDGALWMCCNWRSLPVVIKAAADVNWSLKSCVIWDKNWIGPGQYLRPQYEMVALLAMPQFRIPDRSLNDIWVHPWSSHKPSGHPAEKPVSLMQQAIASSKTREHGLVLDPFAGSGTTGVAAVLEGKRFLGIEQDEAYAEIARRRIAHAQGPLLATVAD